MDPELLRLLLEIFGSQGDADTGSPDSPYVPELTDYLGNYTAAMETPTPSDAVGSQNIGGGADGQQMGGAKPVPSFRTDRDVFSNPLAFITSLMPTTDWNAQPTATGHVGPQTYEDGSYSPGEPDPAMVPQMIARQFQQYPANGVPRAQPAYMNALQAALQQAHANGGRQPRDLFVGRSDDPYFDEYGQALASHRDPINQPTPLTGLFGGTEKPKEKKSRVAPQQAAQQIVRQAQPQRQFSAPAPQRQASFTPAPAPRAAAQATLANALNTLRSLSRR